MTVTLTGNNFYAMKHRLDGLTQKFVDEHGELALERIDAQEAPAQSVLDAVQSLPFLAARKMVVVRSLSAAKATTEQIEQIISSAGDSTDLVFFEPLADKRTVAFKVLKSRTQLEEYDELDTHGLVKWLVEEAEKLGGRLSVADANYLVERAGANQELLANELHKLLAYEPKITRQNIDLLTVETPQSKVFDLLDAAFGGNKKKALDLYDEQRAQKVEPQAIMALLAWQLELIVLAMYSKNQDTKQVAASAGINPYPLMKAQRLASRLDGGRVKSMVQEVINIDELSKTTPLDLDEALKTYITTL
ncbi:MAG TPA: DNA polymerase III subunit delta [Candidatus Saccharimonadales bacterium]|nr:DNA polymerase III subunit delta [Candidatus Saccharimonadales bacterium]